MCFSSREALLTVAPPLDCLPPYPHQEPFLTPAYLGDWMRNFTELVEGIRASFAPHQPLMVFPTRALPRVNQTSGDTQVLLLY